MISRRRSLENVSSERQSDTAKSQRRTFRTYLAGWAPLILGGALTFGCHRSTEPQCATASTLPHQTTPVAEGRPWFDFGLPDPILNQVVLFYLGEAWHQSTDIGEVLMTAERVQKSDVNSWPREWQKTAEHVLQIAEKSEVEGQTLASSQAYLRAASYFRAALHRFPNPKDPLVKTLAQREVSAFEKYLMHSGRDALRIQIPYEGTTLPGYFFRSSKAKGPAPVVIAHQGRDAWAEDNKHIADAANERGFHALLFDGPGMGQVVRLQNLPFRADWENVITPVVDYLATRSDTDMSRIALIGISMGGYLAPRALTVEKRIKLLIANPGVVDWSRVYTSFLDEIDPSLTKLGTSDPTAFNQRMERMMQSNALLKWGMVDSMWRHGVKSPAELMREINLYRLGPQVASISSKTLVVDAEAEAFGQAKELFESLRAPKDYLIFSAADAAQFHVQPGALALSTQRIFEWISREL